MQSLKISLYKSGQDSPEKMITLPLNTLIIGLRFLPKKIKISLEKEGIELTECRDLIKEKGLKGTLIEIGSSDGKMVISIE
jgi:hypothetical protein